MKRAATISADGLYRYDLTRSVQPGCPCARCTAFRAAATVRSVPPSDGFALFVLCNPSKADAETDDHTERRGWAYTLAWGYSSFKFANTNPFRSTDPKKARMPDETIVTLNDLFLVTHAQAASVVVCAWGTNADRILARRTEAVVRAATAGTDKVRYLALTHKGIPKHPLYLAGNLLPQIWNP